jgi:hypothetical protein
MADFASGAGWRPIQVRFVPHEVPAAASYLTPGLVVGDRSITFGRDVEQVSPLPARAFGGGLGTCADHHSEGDESAQKGNQPLLHSSTDL